nr:MAG TPA: hypothetical protein [Caudoviricetes sp.]
MIEKGYTSEDFDKNILQKHKKRLNCCIYKENSSM